MLFGLGNGAQRKLYIGGNILARICSVRGYQWCGDNSRGDKFGVISHKVSPKVVSCDEPTLEKSRGGRKLSLPYRIPLGPLWNRGIAFLNQSSIAWGAENIALTAPLKRIPVIREWWAEGRFISPLLLSAKVVTEESNPKDYVLKPYLKPNSNCCIHRSFLRIMPTGLLDINPTLIFLRVATNTRSLSRKVSGNRTGLTCNQFARFINGRPEKPKILFAGSIRPLAALSSATRGLTAPRQKDGGYRLHDPRPRLGGSINPNSLKASG